MTIRSRVVGPAVSLQRERDASEQMSPAELPECDVLELDCEGAQIPILDGMTIEPLVVVVESHGMLGSSTDEVATALRSRGYEVLSREPAERAAAEQYCVEKDIYVLTAVQDGAARSEPAVGGATA